MTVNKGPKLTQGELSGILATFPFNSSFRCVGERGNIAATSQSWFNVFPFDWMSCSKLVGTGIARREPRYGSTSNSAKLLPRRHKLRQVLGSPLAWSSPPVGARDHNPDIIKTCQKRLGESTKTAHHPSNIMNTANFNMGQYHISWCIRGDNTPQYAEYLGYLDFWKLYPQLPKGKGLEEFYRNILEVDSSV